MPKAKKSQAKPKTKKAPQKLRQQVAALPVRLSESGQVEVLLVTSRDSRCWIIPKGWPMKGKKRHEAAAIEAEEEAGVLGTIQDKALGHYRYSKQQADGREIGCRVAVYALNVTKELADWAEKGQRQMQWVRSETAADLVQEPELSLLLRKIGPP